MEFILDLPHKIKAGAYVINLDECSDIGTHWIALYPLNNNVAYFNSFGVDHIPKKLKYLLINLCLQIIFLEYKNMIQ